MWCEICCPNGLTILYVYYYFYYSSIPLPKNSDDHNTNNIKTTAQPSNIGRHQSLDIGLIPWKPRTNEGPTHPPAAPSPARHTAGSKQTHPGRDQRVPQVTKMWNQCPQAHQWAGIPGVCQRPLLRPALPGTSWWASKPQVVAKRPSNSLHPLWAS